MKGFFNKFTNRLVLGELATHIFLASVLFAIIFPIIEHSYQSQFIQHTESKAVHISSLLQQAPSQIENTIATITSNDLIQARLIDTKKPYLNSNGFGTDGDQLYFIGSPLDVAGDISWLELGFNEAETQRLINTAYHLGLGIVASYILIAALLATLLGPQLTKPLLQLSQAARNISSGKNSQRLNLVTHITEINDLVDDLELMRKTMTFQSEGLATREARLSTIMDNAIDALITINEHGKIQSFNLAAERIFGYLAEDILDKNINSLFFTALTVHSSANDDDTSKTTIENLEPYETMGKKSDGSTFHMEASINGICQLDQCLSIVICRDISERKQAAMEIKSLHDDLEQRVIKRTHELASVNKELKHQALHDALTNLPNRTLLQDRLQQATRAAKRDGQALALMITDLDRFKEINDTLGHHYGDLLLQQVAVRMHNALRDSDTVARLGGDEFAILLPLIQNEEQAIQAALKISEAMDTPFILENQHYHVGISIGIAIYPKDGEDSANLMRRADVAMYVSKRSDRQYSCYDPEQDIHSINRLTMVSDLRLAMEEKQLLVSYQPTIDLHKQTMTGVEALLRWHHPEKGNVPPEEFITLAEQTGLIKPLTLYVLDQALHQLHTWQAAGHDFRMAINLSARNLHDPELIGHIAGLVKQWHVAPQTLQLEITESAIMQEPSRAMETLLKLHQMGIGLSIDDFGTGYSSLSYLKQLPVQEIKIDKSFVQDMLRNNEDKVIVRSTIDLAHNMGHKVIAEGVNSREALEILTAMGCDLAQGFHIGRPLPAKALEHWLENNTQWGPVKTGRKSSSNFRSTLA